MFPVLQVSIICANSGFYKATATFFSYKSATIHLLVDGQVVASTVNASRLGSPQNKASATVGVTCDEIVELSSNSKIAVKVNGDNPVKGFLCLQCIDSK